MVLFKMGTEEEVPHVKDLNTKHRYPHLVASTLLKAMHDVHIDFSTAREAEKGGPLVFAS